MTAVVLYRRLTLIDIEILGTLSYPHSIRPRQVILKHVSEMCWVKNTFLDVDGYNNLQMN